MRWPDSLGPSIPAFTLLHRLQVNSGEYKGHGARAPPAGQIRPGSSTTSFSTSGKTRIVPAQLQIFRLSRRSTMTEREVRRVVQRALTAFPRSRLTQRGWISRALVQEVCEEIMLRMARSIHRDAAPTISTTCAGGVALNCVGNGRLLREGPFRKLVDPARRQRAAGRSAPSSAGIDSSTARPTAARIRCRPTSAQFGDDGSSVPEGDRRGSITNSIARRCWETTAGLLDSGKGRGLVQRPHDSTPDAELPAPSSAIRAIRRCSGR